MYINPKGMGSKVSDYRQVPVCFIAHEFCGDHPSIVQEYLEQVIKTLNREFDALNLPPVKKRERTPGLESITVRCECGQRERIVAGKVTRYGASLKYQCRKTGQIKSVRIL